MKRTTMLGVAVAATVRAPAAAQQSGKRFRVGVLSLDTHAAIQPYFDALRNALAALGYREGQNVDFVVRYAGGDSTRLSALARELVQTRPDVIVSGTVLVVAALERATRSIPIVMINVANPVGAGLVAALGRPGGNVTGGSTLVTDLTGKQIQLLKELVPHLTLVVILDESRTLPLPRRRAAERGASRLGLQTVVVELGSPNALDHVVQLHPKNVGVLTSALTFGVIKHAIQLMAVRRLPAIYTYADSVALGGLMSYGPSEIGLWKQAAGYVDRILKGAKPADLPIQQPTTFDLAVNLKTAHALGITVPQSILLQATQVIR